MTDYEKLCDFQNLYNAHKKARRSKQHKKDVILFEMNLSKNLCDIQNALESRSYHSSDYNRFIIHEPKTREIQALSYYDRIVQHVLCDEILTPFFDNRLIYDNCACRIGKGTHFAMDRLSLFFRDYYKKYGAKGYVLKCDIKKFFPSIHHDVLKNMLDKVVEDRDILNLLHRIIDSFEYSPNRGLPMGNQTSQLFALYYLDPLDRLVKEKLRIKYYIRYMDDMVILFHDKAKLKDYLEQMREFTETRLKVEFNNKTQIFPTKNGVDFLGFHFYLTDSGKVIRKLRTSTKKRFKRRLKHLERQYALGAVAMDEINMSLSSYKAHLAHGHTYKLQKKVFSKLKFQRNDQ